MIPSVGVVGCYVTSSCKSPIGETPSLLVNVSVGSLIQEVMEDSTLASIRELADHNMNGYSWLNSGVLVHTSLDEFYNERVRIVLPLSKRVKALQLAHDNTAHTSIRGMRRLLNSRFVWPGIHGDIVKIVKSCDVCLRINQSGNKKALMVERSILTVPFESVAIDLVGPLLQRETRCQVYADLCLHG